MRTWRTINVFKDKAFAGDSGKETLALPRTHMIGDLWLVARATNTATGDQSTSTAWNSIEKCMTNITIKSGSKTFKSFSGEMCRLMAADRDGRLPPELRDEGNSVEQESVFPIHFGLEPQDEDVILPAPLLDSLDLVLEYTFPTTANLGFVTAAKEFDLYANVLEPTADLEDKMILVQDKKQDYTPSLAGGDTPVDLTLDERRLLRKVYVQAYVKEVLEGAVVSNLKLKADNEEVIDSKWRMLQHQNAIDSHLNFRQSIHFVALSATDDYLSKIPDVKPILVADTTGGVTFVDAIAGDNIGITTTAADDEAYMTMYSDVLPTVAILDFDRDKSLRRLQPQGIRDLDLVLTDVLAGAGAIYEESLQKIW